MFWIRKFIVALAVGLGVSLFHLLLEATQLRQTWNLFVMVAVGVAMIVMLFLTLRFVARNKRS